MPWYEEVGVYKGPVGASPADEIWLSDKKIPALPDNTADIFLTVAGRVLPPGEMWGKKGPHEIRLAPMAIGTMWHVKVWFDKPQQLGATYATPGEHMSADALRNPGVQQTFNNEQPDGGYRGGGRR